MMGLNMNEKFHIYDLRDAISDLQACERGELPDWEKYKKYIHIASFLVYNAESEWFDEHYRDENDIYAAHSGKFKVEEALYQYANRLNAVIKSCGE